MNLFENIDSAPDDPVLGLKQKFNADPNPNKVDLSVGIYCNAHGLTEKMDIVKQVEESLLEGKHAHIIQDAPDYLPIEGFKTFIEQAQLLLFGGDSPSLKAKKIASVQAVGSTSALRYAADFLRRYSPQSVVYVSDPTWPVHRGIFEKVGFKVNNYSYYKATTNQLDFAGMQNSFKDMPEASIVVLHACCHNPTGLDLTKAQWSSIIELIKSKHLIAVIDAAYQGFGESLDEDAYIVRKLVQENIAFFVGQSFSKNFSMYNRRVGALHAICQSSDQASAVLSQLKREVRLNNSTPPIDGAEIISKILTSPELRQVWDKELTQMRDRVILMRKLFVQTLQKLNLGERFASLAQQKGMFSYTGLTKEHALALRDRFGIYILDNGRICVAALTEKTIPYVAEAISKVIS